MLQVGRTGVRGGSLAFTAEPPQHVGPRGVERVVVVEVELVDQRQSCRGTVYLTNGHGAVQRHHRRG